MAVKGKLQRMEVGTPLTLTEAQAGRLGKKVKPIGEKETVDVSGDKSDKKSSNK